MHTRCKVSIFGDYYPGFFFFSSAQKKWVAKGKHLIFFSYSHFAITHKPWVWKLVGSIHDFFNGASMYAWMHQHTLGHHPYTNIDGADPDIRTGERVSIRSSLPAFVQDLVCILKYSLWLLRKITYIDDVAGYSTNQVAAEVAASLLLSTHLYSNAVLCGKFNE